MTTKKEKHLVVVKAIMAEIKSRIKGQHYTLETTDDMYGIGFELRHKLFQSKEWVHQLFLLKGTSFRARLCKVSEIDLVVPGSLDKLVGAIQDCISNNKCRSCKQRYKRKQP